MAETQMYIIPRCTLRGPGFRQSAAWRKDGGKPVEGSKTEFRTCSARRKDGGKFPYLGWRRVYTYLGCTFIGEIKHLNLQVLAVTKIT